MLFPSIFQEDPSQSVSVQSVQSSPLWSRPDEVLRIGEIKEMIVMKANMYKVKDGGQLDPKYFVLTEKKLYYTDSEHCDLIKGVMDVSWLLFDYVDPVAIAEEELREQNASVHVPEFSGGNRKLSFQGDCPDSPLSIPSPYKDFESTPIARGRTLKAKCTFKHENGQELKLNSFKELITSSPKRAKLLSLRTKGLGSLSTPFNSSSNQEKLQVAKQVKKPLLVIKFIRGARFFEFGTYIQPLFYEWIAILKKLCICTNFYRDFKLCDAIATGRNSRIYTAMRKSNGQMYAVKSINKKDFGLKPFLLHNIKSEITVMRKCKHPRIIELFEVYEDEQVLLLVLELVAGPSLEQSCKQSYKLKDTEFLFFMKECVEIIAYLHSLDIVHRNICCRNFKLKEQGKIGFGNKAKLISFSDACYADNITMLGRRSGSLGFVAPEILHVYDIMNTDFFKADIFSLGVVFYTVLTKSLPFPGETDRELYYANKHFLMKPFDKKIRTLNKDHREMTLQMLCKQPYLRPTAELILTNPAFKTTADVAFQALAGLRKLLLKKEKDIKPEEQLKRTQTVGEPVQLAALSSSSLGVQSQLPFKKASTTADGSWASIGPFEFKSKEITLEPVITKEAPKEESVVQSIPQPLITLNLKKDENSANGADLGIMKKKPESKFGQLLREKGISLKRAGNSQSQRPLSKPPPPINLDISENTTPNRPKSLSVHHNNLHEISRSSIEFELNDASSVQKRFKVMPDIPFGRMTLRVRFNRKPQTLTQHSTSSVTSVNND